MPRRTPQESKRSSVCGGVPPTAVTDNRLRSVHDTRGDLVYDVQCIDLLETLVEISVERLRKVPGRRNRRVAGARDDVASANEIDHDLRQLPSQLGEITITHTG